MFSYYLEDIYLDFAVQATKSKCGPWPKYPNVLRPHDTSVTFARTVQAQPS